MLVDVVVGLSYGDEGKGKVTHHLLKSGEYTHCLRFNGGCNAGHTIYHNGQKFVTHHIPAGVFFGIKSIIGAGCVVNLKQFYSEIEMLEKKHRVEDALEAVHSAQQEGILPGGSSALLRAAYKITVVTETDEQQIGVEIIKQAIKEPFRKMVSNAGLSPDIYLEKVENHTNSEAGLDVTIGEMVNMFTYGIIDPFKVIRCALQNAASAASTLLTTDVGIVEEKPK